jgi:hypothetical protein
MTGFDLDLQVGEIRLSFDEAVNVSTLDLTQFTLQSAFDGGESYTLTGGTGLATTADLREHLFALLLTDKREIKLLPTLASDSPTTFASITSGLIEDVSGNAVVAVSSSSAQHAAQFDADGERPEIASFDLDMNYNETHALVHFEFTDVIVLDEFDASQMHITASPGALVDGQLFLRLEEGEVLTPDGYSLTMILTKATTDSLKQRAGLAVDRDSTFITFTQNFIGDERGLKVVAVTPANAQQVRNFTGDTTRPHLLSFDLDMDAGTILLEFSETMNASSLVQSALVLQGTDDGNYSFVVTQGVQTLDDTTTISLGFSTFDTSNSATMNAIKKDMHLATKPSTTFVSHSQWLVADMQGNLVVPIVSGNGLAVRTFTPDTTDPELTSFDLDMDAGVLDFTFSETVKVSTFQPTEIVLQNTASDADSGHTDVRLSGGTVSTDDSTMVRVWITDYDLNLLKQRPLLADVDSRVFVSFASQLVSDMNLLNLSYHWVGPSERINPVVAVPAQSALAVSSYVPDSTQPQLIAAALDMDAAVLSLTFDETMFAASVDPTAVTLFGGVNASGQSYRLTGGAVSQVDWTNITIALTWEDANEIKARSQLAVSLETTFVHMDANGAVDMFNNGLVAAAIAAYDFAADVTEPYITGAALDLTAETLHLNFSEHVNASSVVVAAITLQGAADVAAAAGAVRTLTEGTVSQPARSEIVIALQLADLNRIKQLDGLATSASNTFLQFGADLLADAAGNRVVEHAATAAFQATDFERDATAPVLTGFSLSVNETGRLELSFSETVRVNTLNLSSIQVQLEASGDTTRHQLGASRQSHASSSVGHGDSNVVVVDLGYGDLEGIKGRPALAMDEASTFLAMTSGAIADMAGNAVVAIATGAALQAAQLVPDTTVPRLLSLDLDLNSGLRGVLRLTFSEVMSLSSFDVTQATLYDDAAGVGASVTLTGGDVRVLEAVYYDVISVNLTLFDTTAIKSIDSLCASAASCFISFSQDLVSDTRQPGSGHLLLCWPWPGLI